MLRPEFGVKTNILSQEKCPPQGEVLIFLHGICSKDLEAVLVEVQVEPLITHVRSKLIITRVRRKAVKGIEPLKEMPEKSCHLTPGYCSLCSYIFK